MAKPGRTQPPDQHGRARGLLQIAGVLVVAAVARFATWPQVFTGAGIRLLADSDPHYHLHQAERILSSGLHGAWFDPAINWPVGTQVLWPPLFDLLLAWSTRLWSGASATRTDVEHVAVVVPAVLGVLTLPLVAALARRLVRPGAGWGPALVVALLPAHVALSVVGRPDQHVAEVLLSAWILLSFVGSWTASTANRRRGAALVLGLGVALSFWNWMGSAFNLVIPVAVAGLAHVILEEDSPAGRWMATGLVVGLGSGSLALLLTILAWAPRGALWSGSLSGLTGIQVALTATGGIFGGALLLARHLRPSPRSRSRRLLEVAVASGVAAVPLVALAPVIGEGLRQGLAALLAGNPWYADILEFQPLVFSCQLPLADDLRNVVRTFGLAIPAAMVAAPAVVARWRNAEERPRLLFLATWGLAYLALTLLRRRFAPYLSVPLAILAWEGIGWCAGAVVHRLGAPPAWAAPAVRAVLLAVVLGPTVTGLGSSGGLPEGWTVAMRWLGAQPVSTGREGALTQWGLGHLALYYGGKPVVATPFGTDGGVGAMEAVARFDLAESSAEAAELLQMRRIGYVVLADPVIQGWLDDAFSGPGRAPLVRRTCTFEEGRSDDYQPRFLELMAPRLFYFDGLPVPGSSAAPVGTMRLVYESGRGMPGQSPELLKIFSVVQGARLLVQTAQPGSQVRAAVRLRTNEGRELVWSSSAASDGTGVARLVLPYATGRNGAVLASEWMVGDGAASASLAVSDQDVLTGGTLPLRLGQAAPSGKATPAERPNGRP